MNPGNVLLLKNTLSFPELFPTLFAATGKLTKEQLRVKANKEFQLAPSPNKQNLSVALLFTAVKRHIGNDGREGLQALQTLINSEGKDVLDKDEIVAQKEWVSLVSIFERAHAETPKGTSFCTCDFFYY